MSRALFLGREVKDGRRASEDFRLEADDLVTHGLIVGMTGSGKTALGIVLIEELLKAGVPVLAIDPKGDLANLLLAFPTLSTGEFAPWVDPTADVTPDAESRRWSDGLRDWGLFALDVASYASCREATVYTAGSSAGVPLDLLGSLAPPDPDADEEDRRDLVTAFLSGLLGLLDIEADPVKSREMILLSRSVDALWEKGETATLEALVRTAAAPPFSTVGALPLETFFPARERQGFVVSLNNLLASPVMAAFRGGSPLDVGAMLGTSAGRKPRLSIVSIAHLSDTERLFVVATLLSRVKAWMRRQSGTASLRALVYVDEIFGFFPPSREPAPKKPLLSLLKQARAFGVGVVLATQNPVDLDYKGLANCGCWWVGTLQTERDRKRLEEGLSEAGGADGSALLSQTKKRVFLLHDVHRKEPLLVETRWAMSYLRGPMTKEEIARLQPRVPAASAPAPASPGVSSAASPSADAAPPLLPSAWSARWVEKRGADIAAPRLFVKYAVRYRRDNVAAPEVIRVKLFPLDSATPGEALEGEPSDVPPEDLRESPARTVRYGPLPSWLGASAVPVVERAVRDRLPDKLAAKLLRDPITGALSTAGEEPSAFAARVASAQAPAALREKLEKKKRDLAAATSAEKGRELEKWASVGTAALDVLGGIMGRRKSLRVSKVGSVLAKQRMEGTAEAKIEALKAEIEALEAKIAPPDPSRFETVEVVPLKAHVDVLSIGIAWLT